MYTDFYGLQEPPFNITPDPRFLYLNGCYQEALAALGYGIDTRKGFLTLVGEAGTGKTTLLRRVLDTLAPSTRSVLLLNPTVTFDEILELILQELGIPTDGSGKLVRLQRLNEFLIEHTRAGGNVVLLIDEAQDLNPIVLEELRLLSNLETAREKILQIVLAGQPELDAILADPRLRQLRQRVTLRIRLRPLVPVEVAEYIRARLERAGAANSGPFTPAAMARIAVLSQGVPRVVNVLSDAALLVGFAVGERVVNETAVEEAWRDFEPQAPAPHAAEPEPVPAPVATPPPAPPPPPAIEEPPAILAPPAPPPFPVRVAPVVRAEEPVQKQPEPPATPILVEDDKEDDVAAPAVAMPVETLPAEPRRTLNVPLAAAAIVVFAVTLHLTQRRFPLADEPVAELPAAAVEASEAAPPAPPAPRAVAPDVLAAVAGPVAPAVAHASAPPPEEIAAAETIDSVPVLEAAALIEQFRRAFEVRDSERLAALFAIDAEENGRQGREVIAALYRSQLASLSAVRYELAHLAVVPRGARTEVQAPFVLSYSKLDGERREIRGEAEWKLERRDGQPLIVAYNYRVQPPPAPSPR